MKISFVYAIIASIFLYLLAETEGLEISDECFSCICSSFHDGCEVHESGCLLRTVRRDSDICGPYRISREYWTDAGLGIDASEIGSYIDCTRDLECSEKAISRFVGPRIKDCDQNGRIDCLDIGLTHYFGNTCEFSGNRRTHHYQLFDECVNLAGPPDFFPTTTTTTTTTTTRRRRTTTEAPPSEEDTEENGPTNYVAYMYYKR